MITVNDAFLKSGTKTSFILVLILTLVEKAVENDQSKS